MAGFPRSKKVTIKVILEAPEMFFILQQIFWVF